MWSSLVLLLLIVVLLLILSMVWPPDSPWAPWWRTSDHKIRESLKLAKVTKNDVVFDLGSGDGRVLILAAKEFGARGVGIEIDPLRYLISKLLAKINGVGHKLTIIRGNFFDQDLSGATVVFLYLVPKALAKLKPKLLEELKRGTRIITIKYEMPVLPSGKALSKIAEDRRLGIHAYSLM